MVRVVPGVVDRSRQWQAPQYLMWASAARGKYECAKQRRVFLSGTVSEWGQAEDVTEYESKQTRSTDESFEQKRRSTNNAQTSDSD